MTSSTFIRSLYRISRLLLLAVLVFVTTESCAQAEENKDKNNDSQTTYSEIAVSEFDKMKDETPDLVVVDVRTPEETSEGMIPGAIGLDYYSDDFEEQIGNLEKDKTYILYCRSGNRSSRAAELMIKYQFPRVYNLTGGYTEWVRAHSPDKKNDQ